MSPIKPALSEQEWAGRMAARNYEGAVGISDEGSPYIDDCSQSVHGPASLRHALAALCLHGQPFGFTREDVDHLRKIADGWSEGRGMEELHEDTARLHSLADRIEALLPPELTRTNPEP